MYGERGVLEFFARIPGRGIKTMPHAIPHPQDIHFCLGITHLAPDGEPNIAPYVSPSLRTSYFPWVLRT